MRIVNEPCVPVGQLIISGLKPGIFKPLRLATELKSHINSVILV